MGCKKSLAKEVSARSRTTKSVRIEPHAVFTHPKNLAVVIGECPNCSVSECGSRPQHQYGQGRRWNRGHRAIRPAHCNRKVLLLNNGMLNVEVREFVVEPRKIMQ